MDIRELVLQFEIVLVLTLPDLVAFIRSALETVNVPSYEISELSSLNKFQLQILYTDVKTLEFRFHLYKLGLNFIFFLVFFKVVGLEVVDFFLKLGDSRLLDGLFLVFGFCEFTVVFFERGLCLDKSVNLLHEVRVVQVKLF